MIRLLEPQAAQGALTVDGAAHHYLFHVHRLREGDALEVFDGRGKAFAARVQSLGLETAQLTLEAPTQTAPLREVTVLQGMPKADKLELVIQKASELWATRLVPVYCERSVVKPSDSDEKKRQRWQKIADESARQCGRSAVLEISPQVAFSNALADLDGACLLALDEDESGRTLSSAVRALPSGQPLALLVGPEGGLSENERTLISRAGATSVTLGPLILRTETAALAALAVVRHLDGVLG